jgi:dihydrofolate reductase
MIGIIAAVTQNGVIGVDDKLPFDYPQDMKHFRTKTANSIVIMGRKTYQGIGRPLPKRRNIILSRIAHGLGVIKEDGIEVVKSLDEAMLLTAKDERDVWIIGGSSVYEKGMEYADKIVLTLTPDYNDAHNAIRFPWINPTKFGLKMVLPMCPEDPTCQLQVATYEKI